MMMIGRLAARRRLAVISRLLLTAAAIGPLILRRGKVTAMYRVGLAAALAAVVTGCAVTDSGMQGVGLNGPDPSNLYYYVGLKRQDRNGLCGTPIFEFRRSRSGPGQEVSVTYDEMLQISVGMSGRSWGGLRRLNYMMFRNGAVETAVRAGESYRRRVPACPWNRN